MTTNYDGNRMIYAIFRKDEWFSPFLECCEYMVFIGVLLSAHLLLKNSQQKQMDCSYRGRKQIEKTLWLSSYIFSRIHLRIKTKLHCSGNFLFVRPIWSVDKGYGLWTGKTLCAQIIKSLHNEPHNDNG